MTAILPVIGVDTQATGHANLNEFLTAKFGVLTTIQPGQNGVNGANAADDRGPIQTILDAHAGERIAIAPGIYRMDTRSSIEDEGALYVPSGTDLILHDNAEIRNNAASMVGGLIYFKDASNSSITGGYLNGNRAVHATARCDGVGMKSATNVHVDRVRIANMAGQTSAGLNNGDGVHIRGVTNPGSTHISVTRCHITNCVRQGVSVTRGKYIYLGDNYIADMVGTDPGGGIDIEADNGAATCEKVVMENNFIERCNFGNLVNSGKQVTIIGGVAYNCTHQTLRISDTEQVEVWGGRYIVGPNYTGAVEGANWLCRNIWSKLHGVYFQEEDPHTLSVPLLSIDSCDDLYVGGHTIIQNAGGTAMRVRSGGAHGFANVSGLYLDDILFDNCSPSGSVVQISNDVEGWTQKNFDIRNLRMNQRNVTATNGIELVLVTGPELLTWNIGPNYFDGVTNNYAGFPTGYGPGRQVPTADLPAAGAAMDGKDLVEYIDATHRSLVWYRNGKRFKGASIAES